MSYIFNKKVLALGIAAYSAMSITTAFASDTTGDAKPLSEVTVSVERKSTDVRSRLPSSDLENKLRDDLSHATEHNKKLDDLRRDLALEQQRLSLAKSKLEHEKTLLEIERLKKNENSSLPGFLPEGMPTGFSNGPGPLLPQNTVSDKTADVIKVAPAAPKASPLDSINITRIYGLGEEQKVTVQLGGVLMTVRTVDELPDGIKLVSVTDLGAVFSHNGKRKTVYLSSLVSGLTSTTPVVPNHNGSLAQPSPYMNNSPGGAVQPTEGVLPIVIEQPPEQQAQTSMPLTVKPLPGGMPSGLTMPGF
jgi:hypothetical protein